MARGSKEGAPLGEAGPPPLLLVRLNAPRSSRYLNRFTRPLAPALMTRGGGFCSCEREDSLSFLLFARLASSTWMLVHGSARVKHAYTRVRNFARRNRSTSVAPIHPLIGRHFRRTPFLRSWPISTSLPLVSSLECPSRHKLRRLPPATGVRALSFPLPFFFFFYLFLSRLSQQPIRLQLIIGFPCKFPPFLSDPFEDRRRAADREINASVMAPVVNTLLASRCSSRATRYGA